MIIIILYQILKFPLDHNHNILNKIHRKFRGNVRAGECPGEMCGCDIVHRPWGMSAHHSIYPNKIIQKIRRKHKILCITFEGKFLMYVPTKL